MIIKNTENVKYFITLDEKTALHVQNGNRKLGKGIYTVNLVPGSGRLVVISSGETLSNVPGTCSGCCEDCCARWLRDEAGNVVTNKNGDKIVQGGGCYAIDDARTYNKTVIPSTGENTMLAIHDPDRYWSELDRFCNFNLVAAIRFHSSGEIPNFNYLRRLVDFARRHDCIKIYLYTKRFSWVERYIAENGGTYENAFPGNLTVNASIWHKNYENPCKLPEFIYDDHTEPELENLPHCPAVDKNGKKTGITCAQCRHCMNAKPGEKMCVYAH